MSIDNKPMLISLEETAILGEYLNVYFPLNLALETGTFIVKTPHIVSELAKLTSSFGEASLHL